MADFGPRPETYNSEDPFADRAQGPRTRRKARQEVEEVEREEEAQVQKYVRSVEKSKANHPTTSIPTYESLARLPPAAFPSLDPRLTVKEVEQIHGIRAFERKVSVELDNPFFTNEDTYFGVQSSPNWNDKALPPTISLQNLVLSHREAARSQDRVLKGSIQFYTRGAPDQNLYKTYLTNNSKTGEEVRWHKRVKSDELPDLQAAKRLFYQDSDSDEEEEVEDESGGSKRRRENSHPLLGEYLKRQRAKMAGNNNTPGGDKDDPTRGVAYYESLKKSIRQTLKEKQEIEERLAKIEQSIWQMEGAYLEDTSAGNIIKGFDSYVKASGAPGGSATGGGTASRKKAGVGEQDRLFSRSSLGFYNSMTENSPHASATSTPSHAPTPKGLSDHPTPTSTTSTKAPGLKKKRTEKDDESDGKPSNKRLKITFSRSDKD